MELLSGSVASAESFMHNEYANEKYCHHKGATPDARELLLKFFLYQCFSSYLSILFDIKKRNSGLFIVVLHNIPFFFFYVIVHTFI